MRGRESAGSRGSEGDEFNSWPVSLFFIVSLGIRLPFFPPPSTPGGRLIGFTHTHLPLHPALWLAGHFSRRGVCHGVSTRPGGGLWEVHGGWMCERWGSYISLLAPFAPNLPLTRPLPRGLNSSFPNEPETLKRSLRGPPPSVTHVSTLPQPPPVWVMSVFIFQKKVTHSLLCVLRVPCFICVNAHIQNSGGCLEVGKNQELKPPLDDDDDDDEIVDGNVEGQRAQSTLSFQALPHEGILLGVLFLCKS